MKKISILTMLVLILTFTISLNTNIIQANTIYKTNEEHIVNIKMPKKQISKETPLNKRTKILISTSLLTMLLIIIKIIRLTRRVKYIKYIE